MSVTMSVTNVQLQILRDEVHLDKTAGGVKLYVVFMVIMILFSPSMWPVTDFDLIPVCVCPIVDNTGQCLQ
jgi:hypothetical protein